MLRKLKITESERKEILYLFNQILNEGDGLASLKGVVKFKGNPVPNSQIKLFKDGKLFKGALSDGNGNYLIEGIPLGTYKIVLTNKVEGYDDAEEEITFDKDITYTSYITFRSIQDTKEVIVKTKGSKQEPACLIDISVFDENSQPLGPSKIYILNENDELLETTKTEKDGTIKNLLLKYNKNKGFIKDENIKAPCQQKYTIKIQAEFDNKKSNLKSEEICVWNGKADRITSSNRQRLNTESFNLLNTNVFKIQMNTLFEYKIKSVDSEDNKVLQDAVITLYSDKERKEIISKGNGEITGNINIDRKKFGKFENDIEVYYQIENSKYDTEVGKIKIKPKGTNDFTIPLDKEYLNFKYELESVVDNNNKNIDDVQFKIYSDRSKTVLLKEGTIPFSGKIKRDKNNKNKLEETKIIFIEVSKEGYITNVQKERLTLDVDENKFSFLINNVEPPKPPKDLTERACRKLTKDHYNNMSSLDAGNIKLSEIGGMDKVKEDAIDVKNCYLKYKSSYPDRFKKIINRLINVKNDLSYFQLTFTKDEVRDIYGESKNMSLSNTIRKVISESIETKNILSEEKKIIKNRLLFSLNGVRKNNITEAKTKLKNERVKLLRFGYNQDIVNESFLDVMKGLYGNEGTDVLTDIKTRLGQKIADQVKNKQEEHEMILSAFNELPVEMIERAIKENRVDELSGEISTKALENYRTQFGTEGLSGIMIASVDENKFKQEVAKLLDPAIKDITTKMDEKLKQVQDVVSGGVNPTA